MAEWKLEISRQKSGNNACVIFIHGFQGDPMVTWADFPRLLAENPNMDGWDVLSFGFESNLTPDLTGVWEGDPAIQSIADSLRTFVWANLSPDYGGFIFIAHSMGGLAVQRALLDDQAMTQKVDKVILFGTPSFGLLKAWPFRLPILSLLNRQVRDMGKNSSFIRSLRSKWDERFGQDPPFGFLAVAGSEDEFVPRSASIDGFPDNQCRVVPGNHLEIVKPTTPSDASLGVVTRFIVGEESCHAAMGSAALALERRKFQEVIDQLSPNQERLDRHARVNLALALDAMDDREEAMKVLAGAQKYGTDAMGVLAGRHKRNWIQAREEMEAQTALDLYHRAYRIAKGDDGGKGDAAQAFYHGINLAFLALVYEADTSKAQDIAQEVLGHCAVARVDENSENRMWRLATEGEAYLILGDIDTSLKCYEQAFDGPPKPKPWQFLSTSQQALRIADQLGNEQIAKGLLTLFGGDRL